ncbi:hypothetical protein F4820DRAFT_408526 [Hypoxylon rubiginosum]|uniref:Uncharacterized protein n=1 Tax=Hypoxylon rubiginosum TaxID=110542 RepID=A0ACB9ZB62_9PEZI|nr:hypothetical protein F4820DRAFT_408526 [Hypoxylon rubiginosum]
MANNSSILGELDSEDLQNRGLLGPSHSTGSRRIHKRRLHRSSSEEYSDISLDVRTDSADAASAFATIPITLISYDTLGYLGLAVDKANAIWSEWTHWPATGPRREIDADDGGLQVTFLDFIVARLENYEDVFEDNDAQWRQCLIVCGINESVQDAIMDPIFKDIRLTNSCVYWVKDTLAMRYAGLEDIRRASHRREKELVNASARPGGSHSDNSSNRGSGRGGNVQEHSPAKGKATSQGRRSVSGLQQQTTPGISPQFWNSKTAVDIDNQPGNIVLFKGIDQGRITGLFNERGEVQSIEKLLSMPRSDFSSTRALFYFTPDCHIAEYYAAYAKRRSNCESVVMVSMSIPREAINNLEEPDIRRLYWPSPHWKQLVWRSKTAKPLPKPLRSYRDALLIIGTISKGAERLFENFKTWEDMTDACVLRVRSSNRSNPSEQYVFSGEEEGREFLNQHGKIQVFPFSEAELQTLLSRYG